MDAAAVREKKAGTRARFFASYQPEKALFEAQCNLELLEQGSL